MGAVGVTVFDVRDILMLDTMVSVGARIRLEELAATRLVYKMDPSCQSRLRPGDDYFISNEYKRKVLEAMSPEQLVDICMTLPTVTILPSGRDTYFTATYAFEPLSNAVFTRDQQITTRKVRALDRGCFGPLFELDGWDGWLWGRVTPGPWTRVRACMAALYHALRALCT